jgi:hypothetical protein
MKLLVSGCSVTHGAELFNGFMHDENIKKSFSTYVATHLNLELVNVALSGASNEYIFHSVIDAVQQNSNISEVLVVWTGNTRLYWKTKNRHYFVLPTWSSSMENLYDFKMHHLTKDGAWFTGDSNEIVSTLSEVHKFFITHYLDEESLAKKLKNYRLCLREYCTSLGINYNDITISDLQFVGKWVREGRHPDVFEHQQIAEFIIKRFYN